MNKKEIDKSELDTELLKTEFEALEKVDHPYMVRVLELNYDKQFYYIALELMPNGDVEEYILDKLNKDQHLTSGEIKHFTR